VCYGQVTAVGARNLPARHGRARPPGGPRIVRGACGRLGDPDLSSGPDDEQV